MHIGNKMCKKEKSIVKSTKRGNCFVDGGRNRNNHIKVMNMDQNWVLGGITCETKGQK